MEATKKAFLDVKKYDQYGGVIVDDESLPNDRKIFGDCLDESLNIWQKDQKRGIWLKIPAEKSELIPEAAQRKFIFHHAESTHVMMTLWLPEEPNKLPKYASHTIGVGGFVMTEKGEVLVVAEKFADKPLVWKLPGGLVDIGETLGNAAIREVKEETGIDAKFISVVCFRHVHPFQFDRSDIYFVCRLHPTSFNIHIEESEIAECKWMPIEEYMNHPNVRPMNKRIAHIMFETTTKERNDFKVEQLDGPKMPNLTFSEFYNLE